MPSVGGAGSFTANVFAGLGAVHPLPFSVDPALSSERGTPEIQGAGAIELLAREMTADLHGIRVNAIRDARRSSAPVRARLVTKGVSFGHITADPDGTVHLGAVEGVDRDLVVRPWGQKGTVTSLRTFTVNAMNLHHGMQPRERFGLHLTGTDDFDRDGVPDELTEGDITALVVFQATLGVPGQVIPRDVRRREAVTRGEELFRRSRCAQCHIPALPLRSAIFTEPGPYNLEGTLRAHEVSRVLRIDLTRDAEAPRLSRNPSGVIWVKAFTDLKRHRIADDEKPHFGNEVLVEGLVPVDAFITRRLWAVGNTGPYGHRGDLTTIQEAISHHGGDARAARLEFERMAHVDRNAVLEFLRSLQVLPPGSAGRVLEPSEPRLPYRRRP